MNVTEKQLDEAVVSVVEILQLEPDLSDDLFSLLVHWLDDNGIDVIE